MKRVIAVPEREWAGGLTVGAFYRTDTGRIMRITAVDRARGTVTVED